MRSSTVFAAILATGVLAQPLEQKRDVVVETVVNVVPTTVVVDGNGQPVPTANTPPVDTTAPAPIVHKGKPNHNVHYGKPNHNVNYGHLKPGHAPASDPQTVPSSSPKIPHGKPNHNVHYGKPNHNVNYGQPNPKPSFPVPDVTPPPHQPGPADSYIGVALHQHNMHRANHSAPAVTWDKQLAVAAATLAVTCEFRHDTSYGPATNYGQNIASSSPATGSIVDEIQQVVTGMWYNGEVNAFEGLYGQANPDMTNFESWGHMTQVVWKDSTKIGCHTANCPNMGYFTVCNYGPAGNVEGAFNTNVKAPTDMRTIPV